MFDREKTINEIAAHGEAQQRRGDAAMAAGQLELAKTCYARAKVARDEGLLLHGLAEVSSPEYSYSVQELLQSATQYELVRWDLNDCGEI
jgi:hypothetical protein